MKPTIKVSIGGLAFNLEEDAYRILDSYLQALKNHFKGNPESNEIIADIEFRLSELLQMRLNNKENVVSAEDARDIIKIMGNPKEFDDAENEAPEGNTAKEDNASENSFKKRRLYRDIDNKIIGGVCSGLAHYLRIDCVAIRLVFIGLLFLFYFLLSVKAAFLVVLIYIILWIIIPQARSFSQKLEMKGANQSIENIEDRTQQMPRKYKGSFLGTFLSTLINIIVGILAVLTFIMLIGSIACLIWLNFDTQVVGFTNYLVLLGYDTLNFKVAAILFIIIPIVGLLSLWVKILRRSSFTTATLVSFIIGLVFWLGAASYLGNESVKFAHSHQNSEKVEETITIAPAYQKLYVRLGKEYMNDVEIQPDFDKMLYRGTKGKNREVLILPRIWVREDTTLTGYKIEINKWGFGKNRIKAKRNAEKFQVDYTINDSILILNPKWYSNEKPWENGSFGIAITAPAKKQVSIENPLNRPFLKHSFKWGVSYSDEDYTYEYPSTTSNIYIYD